jgi:hypothetical protein
VVWQIGPWVPGRRYMATVNDNKPTDLKIDGLRISFTYGWHKIVEGQKRLRSTTTDRAATS